MALSQMKSMAALLAAGSLAYDQTKDKLFLQLDKVNTGTIAEQEAAQAIKESLISLLDLKPIHLDSID